MNKAVLTLSAFLILFGCVATPPQKTETVVFYPSLPDRPRLQFLHTITGEEDLGGAQSAFQDFLLGEPTSEKRLGKSYDIASSNGKIYVLDRSHKKLIIINLAENEFDYIRDQRLGELNDPSGIWVTADEIKYIADMKRKQVVVFGRDNNFLRVYGDQELFDKPVDVAVYQDSVYVCDMDKNQIFILDKNSGDLIKTIGERGKEEGQFHKPTHINLDREGNLYVNDAFNYRSQKFDSKGGFLKSFGFHGDTFGAFARPKGLAIDNDGHLYIVDSAYENAQIFDAESGQLLLFFGGSGLAPGNMYLPTSVHIDYTNSQYYKNFSDENFSIEYVVYVGNMFGTNKVNIYGFGHWTGPALQGVTGDNRQP